MSADFFLSVARFLGSKRNLVSVLLALFLFFVSGTTGFIDLINYGLRNVELHPYSTAVALLVFCYACACLIVAAFTWVLANTIKALRLISASLVQGFNTLRIAYKDQKHAKQQIEELVTSLSEQELAFLSLFHANGIALQGTARDLLPHSKYMAHRNLVEKGLLLKKASDGSFIERFDFVPSALPALRFFVYNRTTPHSGIELSLHRVAAAGNSGGGAPGGSR